MTGHARLALAATLLFLMGRAAPAAQQHNWSGCHFGSPICTDENRTPAWGDSRNWLEGTEPHTGDDLVFANASRQAVAINTFMAGTRFRSITIGAPHQLFGEAITLDAGITASVTAIIQLPITLNARQTFRVLTAGANLVFQGSAINTNDNPLDIDGPGNIVMNSPLSGAESLIKEGTGTLQFVGNQPYTGLIQAEGGIVRISGTHSGAIFVDGGRLEGFGAVQGIRASEGFPTMIVAPGGASPNETAIINCVGDLRFRGPGTFEVDLKGTIAGSSYDQLNVTGVVSILSTVQRAQLSVTLVNFTPSPGDSFVIVNNDGTDPVEGGLGGPGEFLSRAEGSSFNVGGTTFFITYLGGDGNDIVLHVPTTRTWDGGGANDKWSTAENWVGDVLPAVGDDLVFPVGAAQLANLHELPAGTVFSPITFQAGGYFLLGNAIALRNGITSTATSGGIIGVNFASLRLELDQSFTNNGNRGFFIQTPIDTNGHRVTFAGSAPPQTLQAFSREISGTGGFTMAASGFCFLDGTTPKVNTYTGTTQINSGTLLVRTAQPSSPVQLTGGTLRGQGQVGPLTATGGSIKPHDGVPEALEVAGDLTLSSTAQFAPDLINNGNLSQLIVTGAVRLNSAALLFTDTHSSPSIGESFMVISNDGSDAVEGTFASLPEGSSFVVTTPSGNRTYSISYAGGDGNDVVLTLTSLPTPTPTPTPTGTPTPTPTATPSPTPSQPLLGNISTRLRVEAGDNVLIGGFIITGVQDKKVLLRAIGPSLSQFFTGTLENPRLELFHGNTLILSNDDWKDTQRSDIEATTIPPANDLESAIVATLAANNNAYTAIVRGVSDGTGVGLVEIYDLDSSVDSKLANISTRGFVQTGDNVLIAGTIVIGSGTQKVLVRAIGPSLPLAGKMENPTLELRDQNGGLLQANDNWIDSQDKQAIIDTTIPPSHDLESAIVATLAANNASYTAIVRGVNDTTGIAVVEVYALQ